MRLKQYILSWLLHHANRLGHDDYFYSIKNRILSKYGKLIGYNIQFIEGKKCYSCGGTGTYTYYDRWGEACDWDVCWNCYKGWYKRPTWNILMLMRFGKYTFHQPYARIYEKPFPEKPIIEGYIEHEKSKYSKFALTALFLLYEKNYIKRWYKTAGLGWRSYFWQFRNWAYDIVYIIKHGFNSIPFVNLGKNIKEFFKSKPKHELIYFSDAYCNDDLPF